MLSPSRFIAWCSKRTTYRTIQDASVPNVRRTARPTTAVVKPIVFNLLVSPHLALKHVPLAGISPSRSSQSLVRGTRRAAPCDITVEILPWPSTVVLWKRISPRGSTLEMRGLFLAPSKNKILCDTQQPSLSPVLDKQYRNYVHQADSRRLHWLPVSGLSQDHTRLR